MNNNLFFYHILQYKNDFKYSLTILIDQYLIHIISKNG